ncbi:DNA polymerase II large subunit [Curtobacterium sp. ER1/6]|nr:DNA polymerase II large subunit [Curtobacterium sp. ER1/6]
MTRLELADLGGDDTRLETGVQRDLLERRVDGDADDVRTGRLVTLQVERVERDGRLDEGDATTGDDALLDGGLRVADGVLDAVLALLELDLGRGTRLDDGHATGELRQALLELLAVVVGVGRLDLGADLTDAARDLLVVAGTLDDRGLVLGDDHLAGLAQQVEGRVLELEADLLGDDLATGQDRDVLQHGLAAVTEARGLDGDGLEDATDLVHDEGREGFAVDVLGDDEELLARLDHLVDDREQVLDVGDLRVDDEDVRVLEDRLLALRVRDEVLRQVALVEAHALGQLELGAEGVRLLDGDDALLADLVDRLGDELADGGVGGRDRRGGGDLVLGLDVLRVGEELVGDGGDGLLDAALERHGVRTGGDVAEALADERLGEHGRGGRPVTGDVVGLLGDLLDELRADLLVRVVELDLLGDGDTVVRDRGGAPLLLEDDVAAARAERHLHGVGQGVQAALEATTGLLVESNDLSHVSFSSLPDVVHGGPAGTQRERVPTPILALAGCECNTAGRHGSTSQDTPRPAWTTAATRTARPAGHDERAAPEGTARSQWFRDVRRVGRTRPAAPSSRCRRRT